MVNLPNNQELSIEVLDSTNGGNTATQYWEVDTVKVKKINHFPSSLDDKYYVDRYFIAQDESKFDDAFKSLIHEIELQSEYYPTYVENGAIGMSGYVDFHDEIGDMMEVKKVHGLARKANTREKETNPSTPDIFYYKGVDFAQHVNSCSGDNLIQLKATMTQLLRVRLNLSESAAQTIVGQIINPDNKMIYWNSETDYSNAFSWYAKADDTFISLAANSDPVPSSKETIPADAAYKITSYWYAAPYDLENTNSFIRIKTSLDETHKQCVTWSVPASMIPLVKYKVGLDGQSLEAPGEISVDYLDNFPMRAFFEVGLRSDINKYNAVEKLKALNYGESNSVLFKDGEYSFYSNKWDSNKLDPSFDQIENADNTISYFKPSVQNDRYYVTTDSPLYRKYGDTYTIYSGSDKPSGTGFYARVPYFEKENGVWALKWRYDALPASFETSPVETSNGTRYYVDIRTTKYPGESTTLKEQNVTASQPFSTYENARDETYVTSILGNNGIFHFTADTGIAITKTVGDNITANANDTFTFVIKPTGETPPALVSGTNYALDIIAADGTVTEGSTQVTAEGTLVVQLKHGETAYLAGSVIPGADPAGLPEGTYSVTEQITGKDGEYFYNVTGIKVDGVSKWTSGSNTVNVTVTEFEVTQVDFTNQPVKTGCIKISKTVPAVGNITVPDKSFTFEVQLDKEHHGGKTFTMTHSVTGASTIKADDDGKLTLFLEADEQVTISGIAAETPVTVTVTEKALPDGFAVTTPAGGEYTQDVSAGKTVAFDFTNTFTPATVSFSGTKKLDGRTLHNEEFSFALYKADKDFTEGTALQTVKNDENGGFSFDSITYTATGTYYYVVREVIPEETNKLTGVTYDSTVYKIKVDVTSKNGKLVAAVTNETGAELATSQLNFTNTYTPAAAGITLTGSKTISGRPLVNGEFTFELYEANSEYAVADDATATQTTNNAEGTFSFTLSFDKEKAGRTFYYVVKEAAAAPDSGVTIDSTEYRVQVGVTYDNDTGILTAVPLVYKVIPSAEQDGQPTVEAVEDKILAFANSYQPASVDFTLSGTKRMEGRDLLATDQFIFELYTVNDSTYNITDVTPVTITNATNGAFQFDTITYTTPGTHYYVVKEKIPTPVDSQLPSVTYDESIYNIQVVVEDNQTGKLICTPTYTKVTATGEAIVENIEFTNIYEARDSAIVISGTKTMNGIRPIAEDEFRFELLQTESDFTTIIEGTTAQQVTNKLVNGKPTFTFAPLEHAAAGTYYYVVKEVPGILPGVSYDPCEYHITVKVTDDTLTGQLVPELVGDAVKVDPTKANVLTVNTPAQITLPVNQLVFTNAYDTEDTSVTFSGTKNLIGRPAVSGEFTFELYETDSDYVIDEEAKLVSTTTNIVTETRNTFSFPAIPFSDQDVGEHYYVIVEQDTYALGVDYDTTRHQIQVTVSDTVDAKLTTTITGIPEGGLIFTNTYTPTDTSFTFSGTKTLNGRKIAANEFRFTLYQASLDTEGKFVIGKAIQTVSNNEKGEFFFSTLPDISAAGTYCYIVKEEEGTLPGVTYDKTEYHITVEVIDTGAALRPTATVTKFTPSAQEPPAADGAALFAVRPDPIPLTVKDLHFTNVYDALDTSVTFSGTKTLSGRSMNAGEFQFSLFTADNEYNPIGLIEMVQNTAEGTFAFSDVPLNAAGIYHYVILEQRGPLAAMTYDATEYHIEVAVIDVNAVLQKSVTITIKDDLSGTTVAPDALTFHNVHDETDAVVVFSGTKTFQGHHLAQDDFSFTLYSADAQFNVIAPLMNTANAADGSFAFKPMVYAQTGTWHYVVREDHGSQSYINYDQAEYRITVNVWNNNGVLVADVSAVRVLGNESTPANALGGLAFTNLYTPASVTVPFPGKKVYQGAELTEGLFTFQLYAADPLFLPIGAPLETVTNGADGSFAFSPRNFHTAGVHRFLVVEDATLPIPNVVYDPTVYHVTVTVTDNGVGALEATVQVTTSEGLIAEMPVFENAFWATPDTGDHSDLETMLALCLTSLAALTALMFFSRRKVRI